MLRVLARPVSAAMTARVVVERRAAVAVTASTALLLRRFGSTVAADATDSTSRLTFNKNMALTFRPGKSQAPHLVPPPEVDDWIAASKLGSYCSG